MMKSPPEDAGLSGGELLRVLDELRDSVFRIDSEGVVTYVNDAACRVTGYSREEIVGKPFAEFLAPEEMDSITEKFSREMGGEEIGPYIVTTIDKKGDRRRFRMSTLPFTSDGEVVGKIGVAHEITEQEKKEELLRYHSRFKDLITALSTHFINLSTDEIDGGINYALQAIGEFTGVDRSYLILVSEDRETLTTTYEWCAEGVKSFSERTTNVPVDTFPWLAEKLREGEAIYIPLVSDLPPEAEAEKDIFRSEGTKSVVVVPLITSGEILGAVGFDYVKEDTVWSEGSISLLKIVGEMLVNALERKRMEKALMAKEKEKLLLAENTNDIVWTTDMDGNFLYVSPSAGKILGHRPDELTGKSCFEFMTRESAERALKLRDIFQGPEADDVPIIELHYLDSEGRPVPFEVSVSLVCDEKGVPAEVIGVSRDVSERKKAEEALRESEEKYRSILDQETELVCRFTPELKLTFVNEAYCRFFGKSREELIGSTQLDHIPNGEHDALKKNLKKRIRPGELVTLEHTDVRHDGEPRILEWRRTGVFDDEGKLVEFQSTGIDITELRETEAALRDSEEQFRALAEQSPNMIFINQGGKIVYANSQCEEVMGYTKGEFYSPGFDFRSLIAPEYRDMVESNFKRHMSDREVKPMEYAVVTKDGRKLDTLITTRLINYGGEKAILGVVTDISAVKEAEKALRESEQKFRSIFEQSKDGIVLVDEEGGIIGWNRAQERITGVKKKDVLGRPLWGIQSRINAPGDNGARSIEELKTAVLKSLKTGKAPWYGKLLRQSFRRSDGSVKTLEVTTFPIKTGKGFMAGSVIRDVTEDVKSEAALRVSEEKYRSLVDNALVGIYRTTFKGDVLYVNKALSNMFGFKSPEEMMAENVVARYRNPADRKRMLQRLRKEGRVPGFETEVLAKKGDVKNVILSASAEGDVISGMIMDVTAFKAAEQELRISESRLRSAVESMPFDLFFLGEDRRYVLQNSACRRHWGRIIGKKPEDIATTRENLKLWRENNRRAFNGEIVEGEVSLDVKGEERHFHNIIAPVEVDGKVKGILGVNIDVTGRKKAEEMLRESEERYRGLLESQKDLIVRVDTENRFTFVNNAYCRKFGKMRNQLLGKKFTPLVHKDDLPATLKAMEKLKKSPYRATMEQRAKTVDGWRWLEWEDYAIRDDEGRIVEVQGVGRDITDRKLAEQALKASERRYRTMIDALGDAIHLVGRDLRIMLANKTLKKWNRKLGLKTKVEGEKIFSVYPFLPKKVRKEYTQVFKEGKTLVTREVNKVGKREFTTETRKIPVLDGKKVVRVITVVRDITQRERAEEALREAKEFSENIVETANAIIVTVDSRQRITTFNQYAESLTGYVKDEIMGKKWTTQFIPRGRRKEVNRLFKNVLRKRIKDVTHENPILAKDGREKIVKWSNTVLLDQGNNPVGMLAIGVDVTEARRAEESLRDSEERYSTLFKTATDMIAIHDMQGGFIDVNQNFCGTIGYSRKELLSMNIRALAAPGKAKTAKPRIKQIKSEGKAEWESQLKRKDGSLIDIEFHSVLSSYRDEDVVYSILRDISERKNAEQELLAIKTHLEAVLDGISESIVVLDKKYNVISYNRAFQRWVGRPKADLRGGKCYDIIHGFDKSCRKCVIRDVFKSGEPSESVHYHQGKRGRVYHETRAYPILKDGEIEHAIYVFRDVTERERMKEKLRDNYEQLMKANEELRNLDKMKTEFLSIASHELRTPLAIIKGYADILASEDLGALNKRQKDKMQRIGENAKQLDRLVNNILDLTKMDAGELHVKKTRFSFKRLVDEVVSDLTHLAEAKKVKLKTRVRSKSKILADRMRLKQLLVNCVDNAVKFTPEGGEVTVSVSETDDVVRVKVSDTGIGMGKKDLENIFRRFYQIDSSYQRQYKGVGLGLAICKRIVDLHGGEIDVKSRKGRGTTIIITLPLNGKT